VTWVNNDNGEELDQAGAAEIGLDLSRLPQGLDPGQPRNLWGVFSHGIKQARKRLKKPGCGQFYGGQGLATMNATHYRLSRLDLASEPQHSLISLYS
jgi:hypothetical protein